MEKYNIIHADPPWNYRNKNTGGSMQSGAAAKYSTLTVEELCQLPVKLVADRNSVLFLWVTVPLLPEGLRVMEAWGYKYKTTLFWRKKMSLGMGFWFRGQVECLLFGIRGKVRAFRCQEPNFIQSQALKHSEKPEEFRELIERATSNSIEQPRKLELFGRQPREGWDVIGNDIDGRDIRDSLNDFLYPHSEEITQ